MAGSRFRIPLARLVVVMALAAALAPVTLAADSPLIPREVIFGNPERAAVTISPDGTRIAYLAPVAGVLNVWVRTLGKTDDRAVTQDTHRGITQYLWAEDNKNILYLQDADGDENWHVYATELATGMTTDLSPIKGVQANLLGTDEKHPNEVLLEMNARDPSAHDAYRVDLTTGARHLEAVNPGNFVGWVVDPQFRIRGAQALTPDGGAVALVRDTAGDWQPFVEWGPDDNFSGVVGFTPDGKGLYLSDSRNANSLRLVTLDLASQKQTVLVSDPQYDIGEVIVNPKTYAVQAAAIVKARNEWTVLDKSIAADLAAIKKIHGGDFSLTSRTQDDRTWVISFTTDAGPIPYYIYHRDTKKATFLFSNRPKLEQFTLAAMKPVEFKARDGLVLHGYLTTPPGRAAKKLPLVLNVHGGPWARDVWGYDGEAQWLANRGYAVLQVNFRGSTGYGKKFLNAGNKEWGGKMHTDLIDAVNWAVKQSVADPQRIAIYGGSYGGYAALCGAAFTPDVFKCAVDIVGPSSLLTFIETIPPYWAPFKKIFDQRVGDYTTERDMLRARSPISKVDQIRIPLLIAQGANDPRVNVRESDQMVAALKARGVTVDYMVFADEGHGFARPENRLTFYAAAEKFLAKHLGGRAEN